MNNHDNEQRYSRHLSLQGLGESGQAKLRQARVLVIGVGGLGCPLSLYLAASGVGILGLIDPDRVSLSNLNRQILFETADIGRLKTDAAADRLEELNPEIQTELHPFKLDAHNAEKMIAQYDVVADGSDNPETRYLVNATCHSLRKPLISAAIHGWEGQLYRFDTSSGSACYQCLYPDSPLKGETPTCAESGVLSPLAGMMGSWQAAETVKQIVNIGETSILHRIDLISGTSKQAKIQKDSACPVCS
ncbi:MAG: HesA/MoeB/ThiF family protein [Rickettsiales bacterium]|nr:HesA/MoeB/ThiF family protein [Rickettsiales bacterium]